MLLVSELLNPVRELLVVVELLALGDDAGDAGEVRHAVQALHLDVARGGTHPLVDAVDIVSRIGDTLLEDGDSGHSGEWETGTSGTGFVSNIKRGCDYH